MRDLIDRLCGQVTESMLEDHWEETGNRGGDIARSDGTIVFPSGPHERWYVKNPRGQLWRKSRRPVHFPTADSAMNACDKAFPLGK